LREQGIAVTLRPNEYIAEDMIRRAVETRLCRRKALSAATCGCGAGACCGISLWRRARLWTRYTFIDGDWAAGRSSLRRTRAGVDIITFTSSSTSKFLTLLGVEALPIASKAVIACIGPITAQTAREMGLHVDVVADEYTVSGLVAALEDYLITGKLNFNNSTQIANYLESLS
jgi:hypothetical protein